MLNANRLFLYEEMGQQSNQVTAFVLLCNLLGWTIRNQLFSTFLCLNCKVELKLIFLQCSLFDKKKTFVKLFIVMEEIT